MIDKVRQFLSMNTAFATNKRVVEAFPREAMEEIATLRRLVEIALEQECYDLCDGYCRTCDTHRKMEHEI